MEKKDLIVLLGIIGIAILLTANGKYNFFAVYSPKLTTVTMELNFKNYQYQKRVTFIKYIPDTSYPPCGGDLQPYKFKIKGIDPSLLEDNKCYLKLDIVTSQPCVGRDWIWEIKNVTLVAPYENGICDFYNKGRILNPETSYYHYLRTPNFGEKTEYTKTCDKFSYKRFCLDKILLSSKGVTGILYFKIKKEAPQPQPPSRCGNGICEPNYGENEKTCPADCAVQQPPSQPQPSKPIQKPENQTKTIIQILVEILILVILAIFLLKKKPFSFGF